MVFGFISEKHKKRYLSLINYHIFLTFAYYGGLVAILYLIDPSSYNYVVWDYTTGIPLETIQNQYPNHTVISPEVYAEKQRFWQSKMWLGYSLTIAIMIVNPDTKKTLKKIKNKIIKD